MNYLQVRGAASAAPSGQIQLGPPLRLLWSFADVGASALVKEQDCVVWAGGAHALVCLDPIGQVRWRQPCEFVRHAIWGDTVLVTLGVALPDLTRFVALDLHTGREQRSAACDHLIDKVLPSRPVFVGSTIRQQSEHRFRFVVAAVNFSGALDVLWTREEHHDYESQGPTKAYDWDVACDDTCVFIARGGDLVALDLTTGQDVWVAPLGNVGGAPDLGGKTVPMVSDGLVVINTAGGTAAFRVTSGQLAWFFPKSGARTVYGGRVHFVTTDEYYVLDLVTGRCLLQASLGATTEKKWRLKSVQFSSHLAVSETHGFIGDTRGRLYAFERATGEPVWMDRPHGITGFSGNIPVIAGNRLYISSFSMAPAPPPRLYCYEGVG